MGRHAVHAWPSSDDSDVEDDAHSELHLIKGISLGALLAVIASSANGQALLPEWRVCNARRVTVEADTTTLYRVTSAAQFGDGGLALADAGNQRILLFSSGGRLTQRLGRRGGGPGEFNWINAVLAFGDTIVAYDGPLRRVTTFMIDGTVMRVDRLPTYDGYLTDLAAVVSPTEMVVRTRELPVNETRPGLYTDSASLLLFRPETRELTFVTRVGVSPIFS
jgi:hypothetical protein